MTKPRELLRIPYLELNLEPESVNLLIEETVFPTI